MLVQNDEGKVLEADAMLERAPQVITQRPLEMYLVGYALARLGHPRADGRPNAPPGLAWRIGMGRRLPSILSGPRAWANGAEFQQFIEERPRQL